MNEGTEIASFVGVVSYLCRPLLLAVFSYQSLYLYHVSPARYCNANAVTVSPYDTKDGFCKCSSARDALHVPPPVLCLAKLNLLLHQRFPMDDSHDGANSS